MRQNDIQLPISQVKPNRSQCSLPHLVRQSFLQHQIKVDFIFEEINMERIFGISRMSDGSKYWVYTVIGPSPIAHGLGLSVQHIPWEGEPPHWWVLRDTSKSLFSWPSLQTSPSAVPFGTPQAFPVHIVEPWNKLPPEIVDSASEEIFKLRLHGVWDSLFVPLPSSDIQQIRF